MKFDSKNPTISKKIITQIKKTWLKHEKKILEETRKITGIPIKTANITCSINDSITNGLYGDNSITLGVKGGISADNVRMVIAHELFHIFYWKNLKKMHLTKSSPGNEARWEWNLAEVAAFLLTNEPALKRYWPEAKVYLYPEIKSTYKKVKSFWKQGDLDFFLMQSYKILK